MKPLHNLMLILGFDVPFAKLWHPLQKCSAKLTCFALSNLLWSAPMELKCNVFSDTPM